MRGQKKNHSLDHLSSDRKFLLPSSDMHHPKIRRRWDTLRTMLCQTTCIQLNVYPTSRRRMHERNVKGIKRNGVWDGPSSGRTRKMIFTDSQYLCQSFLWYNDPLPVHFLRSHKAIYAHSESVRARRTITQETKILLCIEFWYTLSLDRLPTSHGLCFRDYESIKEAKQQHSEV